MSLVRLLLLALVGLGAEPDPAALVGDLASPQEAVRTEAAGALEELGRPALPALYRACDSDDPDLRRQAAKLVDLIERQRLLRATKVRLDFEDRSLTAVADALRAQTGFPVLVESDEAARAKRVSLHATEPVSFWDALDRLGAACGVRHSPGVLFSPSVRESRFFLGAAEGPPVPASNDGPFRVYLVRLARHREATPVRPPAEPIHRDSLSAELHLVAEPGLVVNPIGPFILDEVVDDRGQDLRPDPPIGRSPGRLHPPRFEEGHASLFALHVPLKSTGRPGGRIRRFKGHVPITVMARMGDPIVAPLAGAEGQPFSKRGMTLSVTGVGRAGENTTFTLTIGGAPLPEGYTPRRIIPLGEYQPPYRIEDHVQIQDDQGRALMWNAHPLLHNIKNGEQANQVTVHGSGATRVLYHGVVGDASEVVFEFTDLPFP